MNTVVYKHKGLTLMEVLTVLIMISILVAVGYPNFTRLRMEARRADAHASVIAAQGIVQRFLAENNQSNITSSDLNLDMFEDYKTSTGNPIYSNDGYYKITIETDSSGYIVRATAVSTENQYADTLCREIYIEYGEKKSKNSTGTVANAAATKCW